MTFWAEAQEGNRQHDRWSLLTGIEGIESAVEKARGEVESTFQIAQELSCVRGLRLPADSPCSLRLGGKVKTPWSPILAKCRIFYHSQLSTHTPGSPHGGWNSGLMVSTSWIVPKHILDKHEFNILKEEMQHQIETGWDDLSSPISLSCWRLYKWNFYLSGF